MVTLNLHHRGVQGTRVPGIVRSLVLDKLARIVFLNFQEEKRSVRFSFIIGNILIEALLSHILIRILLLMNFQSVKKYNSNIKDVADSNELSCPLIFHLNVNFYRTREKSQQIKKISQLSRESRVFV